jgi:CheY-like chemotaxis protein
VLSGGAAVPLAKKFKPAAILLDIRLPDLDGWALLDRLKHDSETRHIPVHIVSGRKGKRRALKLGARSFLEKPVSKDTLTALFAELSEFLGRKERRLLVVEEDEKQAEIVPAVVNIDEAECSEYVLHGCSERGDIRIAPVDVLLDDQHPDLGEHDEN